MKNYLIFFLAIIFVFSSCKKTFEFKLDNSNNKMLLFYMSANNNLENEAINSINNIEKGITDKNKNILVFVKTNKDSSYLLKINPDQSGLIQSDTIKRYGSENSSNPEFLNKVINDSRNLCKADKYGIVFWSHGTSWLPQSNSFLKSFGDDGGIKMDIIALKNAIPNDFEYIGFDACSMASIEVLYELKDKCKYILASPSEVLSTGIPYDLTINNLYAMDSSNLVNAAKNYIYYYNKQSGNYSSATISLIKTEKLNLLSKYLKILLITKPDYLGKIDKIQRLDFDAQSLTISYDLLDIFKKTYYNEEVVNIEKILNSIVVYKNNTPKFLGKEILDFCGLTAYLPETNDAYLYYYKNLDWYKESGWSIMFN